MELFSGFGFAVGPAFGGFLYTVSTSAFLRN